MHKLHVLIVEDESLLALELATTITQFGCHVEDYVTTPQKAKEVFESQNINLIFMDINLDDTLDGIDLYKSFHTDTPIIYITAYKDEATISKAIETKPLGYLTKPYSEAELSALVKLARMQQGVLSPQELIYFQNNYSFHPQTEELYHTDHLITLSVKKLQLLKLLLNAKGSVVSYMQIEDELYKENPPSSSSIRTLIYRLRSTLQYADIQNELNYGIRLII